MLLNLSGRPDCVSKIPASRTQRLFSATASPLASLILAISGAIAPLGCVKSPAVDSQTRPTISVMGFTLTAGEELKRDTPGVFADNPQIAVDLIPTPGSSIEQFQLMRQLLASHSPVPDVYLVDSIWLGALQEHLLDLTPYLDEADKAHLPQLIWNDTLGGRVLSLPLYVNLGMLYYRRDLLEKYGYKHPPATWTELRTMALRIQQGERAAGKKDFWGYVWQGGLYEGLTCNALEWQSSFGGGHVIERNGQVTVNNERAAEAFRTATDWIGYISPPSVLSYTEGDTLSAYRSGNAAFMRYWSRGVPMSSESGVALLPAGPQGRAHTAGVFHFVVSRYSRYFEKAARLVTHLAGPRVQLRRALRSGYLPTVQRLYREPSLMDALPQAALLNGLEPAAWVTRPSIACGDQYADVSRAYYQTVHKILSRKVDAKTALADLEMKIQGLVSSDRTGIARGSH